jgi:hypothetical protein
MREHIATFAPVTTMLSIRPMKNYWLVKQEPEAYSWDDFVRDGRTKWTGVRNFLARKHLRAMRKGDAVLFYHSVSDKAVVGIAEVTREAFPDPTARGRLECGRVEAGKTTQAACNAPGDQGGAKTA